MSGLPGRAGGFLGLQRPEFMCVTEGTPRRRSPKTSPVASLTPDSRSPRLRPLGCPALTSHPPPGTQSGEFPRAVSTVLAHARKQAVWVKWGCCSDGPSWEPP